MKKEIPYHPELREVIPSLGFRSSTGLIRYLQEINTEYIFIGRAYASRDRIKEKIDQTNDMYKNRNNKAFIFVMDIPETNTVDVMCILGISKEELIKYLQLKAFS